MNHRDLDRHITGNGGEDQYPEEKFCSGEQCYLGVYRNWDDDGYLCMECHFTVKDPAGRSLYVLKNGGWWMHDKIPDNRPKCARCETRISVLDAESVCPVCREAEVERDDGC